MQIYALGRAEEAEEIKMQNDEWILCITDFDLSSLPEEKQVVAGVITRKLVERLSAINYRTRISPEYAFYEETAWANARTRAARALASKQEERSALVYRGDPAWMYRRNLERIDADIEKLRLALFEAENDIPLIHKEPVFGLTADNLEFKFPAIPRAGNEYRFCRDRKSDAFLQGTVVDFHGRFFVSLKLYTMYTQSFVWDDYIIFSHDDLEEAIDEIVQRLIIVLSGNQSAAIVVKAQPEDTLVLINRSFAGRGQTEILEYPPGLVTIEASAPDHESMTFVTDIFAGEIAEITIGLKPVEYVNVDISSISTGSVFHGALYAGEAPLTLRLPVNQLEYIELETPDRAIGSVIFQVPNESEFSYPIFLRTSMPPANGRVEKTRNMFYWAWGGTWITGIAAWLTYQSFISSNTAINYVYDLTGSYDQKFYDSNMRMYYIGIGSIIAVSAAVLFDIIFASRYIIAANRSFSSISGTGRD